jgi:hypothetical protein
MQGVLSRRVNWLGLEAEQLLSPFSEVYLHATIGLHGVELGHRDNFTLPSQRGTFKCAVLPSIIKAIK